MAVLTLIGLRNRLRRRNLYTTRLADLPAENRRHPDPPPSTEARTLDGTYNDLDDPTMGSVGAPFGRNFPPEYCLPEGDEDIRGNPDPGVVSRELLTRDRFLPAGSLNVLAAAWIQFEVHDWVRHATQEADEWRFRGEIPGADPYDMRIRRSKRYEDARSNPIFTSRDTHWWDGSQLYGTTKEFSEAARSEDDGKLTIDDDGLLSEELDRLGLRLVAQDPGDPAANMWIGLSLLHTLFALEHNAICEELRRLHPTWSGERLYDTARLINAALMAKIHTVEWTPAVIAHPTTQYAIRATWWGVLGKRFTSRFGRVGSGEVLSGVPGSRRNHQGVPYALTEEFVAIYRMHPLLPDEFTFRSIEDHSLERTYTLQEVAARRTREVIRDIGAENALYSLGTSHPGAITLHNYPKFLQRLERPDLPTFDLAVADIVRSRECGVPRYNRFRQLVGLKPVESFDELTDNRVWGEEIREVYDGDIDGVDLMIGLYAEPTPSGFAFSDTAFRIFLLMATRRLQSDRFFTVDYTAETYTPMGIDWINRTTMTHILLRHYPELAPALRGVENVFHPWNRVPVGSGS